MPFIPTAGSVPAGTPTKVNGRTQYTGGDCSTVSTTWVDLNAALTVVLTTGASRCLVTFQAWGQVDSGGGGGTGDMEVGLSIDGVIEGLVGHTKGVSGEIKGTLSYVYVTTLLSAGSHTFKPVFQAVSSTANIISSATSPVTFGVIEL